ELETDSNIDIALMLLKRATKDIATIIARETFLGTGKIKGILNNLTLQETALTATTENKIIIDDLIKLTTAIDIAYWDNAKIFVSLEYFKKLKALKDVNGLQIIKGKKFDEIDIIVCSELDNTEYPILFANVEKLYCYFTDEKLETDTHYDKVKNTSIKILKMAVGGRIVDTKACCLLKK
ncbi:MAG: phage major capsid protein, partial [Cetobacterium sp.]